MRWGYAVKPLFLLLVVGALSCQQQRVTTVVGNLAGSHAMVHHGQVVVVTSTDLNELRVLWVNPPDITTRSRRFVGGPNPIETLSVPVIDRPALLAQALGVDGEGQRIFGKYVFVGSPGGKQVSIVHVDPNDVTVGLVEVGRIPVPAPISAIAGGLGADGTPSLYVATYDGLQTLVLAYRLAPDAADFRQPSSQVVGSLSGSAVVAMLVLPPLAGRTLDGAPFCDTSSCLAVSTRRDVGRSGESLLLELSAAGGAPRTASLAFGAPVRFLASHVKTSTLGAGQRLFALRNEDVCGGLDCGGVVSVDTLTGVGGAFPSFGSPFVRTAGLPQTIALGLSTVTSSDAPVELAGVMTMGSGRMYFFDGLSMAPVTIGEVDYVVAIDQVNTTRCQGALLPGQAVWDTTANALTTAPRLFVSYPSANAVVEVRPAETSFRPSYVGDLGVLNNTNTALCYR